TARRELSGSRNELFQTRKALFESRKGLFSAGKELFGSGKALASGRKELSGALTAALAGRGRPPPPPPLPVPHVPPPAQRLVELHQGRQPVVARLRQEDLRREELLLGLEHLQVGGEAGHVALVGDFESVLEGPHLPRPLPLGLRVLLVGDERSRGLVE